MLGFLPRAPASPLRHLRGRAVASCLGGLALALVTGCGGQGEVAEDDPGADVATGDHATHDGPTDGEGTVNDGDEATAGTADDVVAQAAAAMDGSWQVTYDSADGREVIVANDGGDMAVAIDGEVVLRVTPSGPMSCAGGECMLLPMDADTPLGQLLLQDVGPAAAGLDLGRLEETAGADAVSEEVAGRAATCVTMAREALAADGTNAPDETASVCVDVETGAVLRSHLGDDAWLEATSLTTTPDPDLFIS